MLDWPSRGVGRWMGSAVLTVACAGNDERPPALDTGCTTFDCSGGTAGSVSTVGGAGGASGEPGLDCVSEPDTGTSFTGDVSAVADVTLNASGIAAYSGIVELRGTGLGGCRAETTYDGSQVSGEDDRASFVLGGLEALSMNWVFMRHVSGEPELISTITPVNTSQNLEVYGALWMVSAETLDTIFEQAGVTREPDRAHLLVQILDLYGMHAGAVVAAGSAPVAYHGATWSTALAGTGGDGYALVMNVEALEPPGRMLTITIDGAHQSNELLVAAGHLTSAQVTYESYVDP